MRPRVFVGLLWAISLAASACDGVFSLNGQVRDTTGKPVPGAVVTVYGKAFPDSGLKTSTDSTGSFDFFKVTAPFQFTARIEIDKTGHQPAAASISKALEPHRVTVLLQPLEGKVVSEVRFEDPAQD
jgi:hypothetical protein